MSNFLAKAVNNSTWTAIGSLGTAVLGFLFAGLTIRWLGEAEAGFAIAVSTIAGINSTFTGLGLGDAATRLISKAHAEKDFEAIKPVAGVCFSASLGFGLLGFCLFSFGASFIIDWAKYEGNPDVGKFYCILAGFFFLFNQVSNYFNTLLGSLQRFDFQTKINLAFNLANGLCGVTLLKAFPSLLTVGLVLAVLSVLQFFCMGLVLTKELGFLPVPTWNKKIFLELWGFGRWVYLTQITGVLINGVDKIYLISVFGSASIPFYTFAQRIYQTVHTTLVGQAHYLFPMFSAQGDKVEEVAERTDERLRWFIGLIAGLIFSGLIIAGPALLTITVNSEFAKNASFQLFVFCWVGYFHSHSIIPFFVGLSKGDAKGNWIYHIIAALGTLPFLILFSTLFGFRYAVVGQLMILVATIYLCWRVKGKTDWRTFSVWFVKPLCSSLLLMCLACGVRFVLYVQKANPITQFVGMGMFYLLVVFSMARIERNYLGGTHRIETLGRALTLLLNKFGLSGKLFFQLLGIQSNPTKREHHE